jgi:uncharacterized membrane protein YbhN (UPF0104 family)
MTCRVALRLGTFAIAIPVLMVSAWYLRTYFDWVGVGQLLGQTRLDWFLIGCGLLYIAYLCVRTLRWVVMIRVANSNARFVDFYMPLAILLSISIFTPGQIGETLKVEVLKRQGLLSRTAGFGSFLIERIMDIFVVLVFAAISLLVTQLTLLQGNIYWLLGGLALLACIALLVLMFFKPTGRLGNVLDQLRATGKTPSVLVIPMLLTIVSWLLVALGWQVAFAAVGVWLSTVETITVMTLTTLGILISFIPSGIGVSEVMISELLLTLGIDSLHAQAGALILRLMGIWWLCIGLLHLLYWWLRRRVSVIEATQ